MGALAALDFEIIDGGRLRPRNRSGLRKGSEEATLRKRAQCVGDQSARRATPWEHRERRSA
jgi:hypothetical protein